MTNTPPIHLIKLPFCTFAYQTKPVQLTGSQAVRQLLAHVLTQQQLDDTLNETQLPYRLQPSQQLVSFSHSNKHIAVAFGKVATLGIDIEDNMVSMQVAQRFFHTDEVVWLGSLPPPQQALACNKIWTIKEALIKTKQPTKLIHGLKTNTLALVKQALLLPLLAPQQQPDQQAGVNIARSDVGLSIILLNSTNIHLSCCFEPLSPTNKKAT